MTTYIDTKLGRFEVRDDRGSDPRDVARVWPVDDYGTQCTVRINSKPYKGPFTLTRSFYNQEYRHVRACFGELTDSARTKLTEVLAGVWGLYPVLTHDQKIPLLLREVRGKVRTVLDRHLDRIEVEVLRSWKMSQRDSYHSEDHSEDPVTAAELEAVKRAAYEEAVAWLTENGWTPKPDSCAA